MTRGPHEKHFLRYLLKNECIWEMSQMTSLFLKNRYFPDIRGTHVARGQRVLDPWYLQYQYLRYCPGVEPL